MPKIRLSTNIKSILIFFTAGLGIFCAFVTFADGQFEQVPVAIATIEYQLPQIEAEIKLNGKIEEKVGKKALKVSLNY